MNKLTETLRDLINTSQVIENRINELVSSTMQDEFDGNDTVRNLFNEAITQLLELLANNGITFHTDAEELFSSYHTTLLIALYQRFIPSNIGNYLDTLPELRQNIATEVSDISDNEYLCHLLEAVSYTERSELSKEMFSFFFDKITNSSEYVAAVNAVLIKDPDRLEVINFTEEDTLFLVKVADERRWFQKTLHTLIFSDELSLDLELANTYTYKFGVPYTLPENAIILSNYDDLIETNRETVIKLLQKIKENNIFYQEHYTDDELKDLSLIEAICIILTQYSDKRLFKIEPDLTRLTKFNNKVSVTEITKIITATNLNRGKE